MIFIFFYLVKKKSENFQTFCKNDKKVFNNVSNFFHFHFIKNYTPEINNKKLDFYLKEFQVEDVILENVKNILLKSNDNVFSNINFDNTKFYIEDARENLSLNYIWDKDIDLELQTTTHNLLNKSLDKDVVSETLLNLVNLNNLEKDGLHFYFLPYVGNNSFYKTVMQELNEGRMFPISFIGLYYGDENNIEKVCQTVPNFNKNRNMLISKILAQQILIQSKVSFSSVKHNLMHDSLETYKQVINNFLNVEESEVSEESEDIEKINILREKISCRNNSDMNKLLEKIIILTSKILKNKPNDIYDNYSQDLYNYFYKNQDSLDYILTELSVMLKRHYIDNKNTLIIDNDFMLDYRIIHILNSQKKSFLDCSQYNCTNTIDHNDCKNKRLDCNKENLCVFDSNMVPYPKCYDIFYDILTRMKYNHKIIILSEVLSFIPLSINTKQIETLRNSLSNENFNIYSDLKHINNIHIIDKTYMKVDPMDKVVCNNETYNMESCENHPCPGGTRNMPQNCCSNNYDYRCLEDDIVIRDSEFRKTSEYSKLQDIDKSLLKKESNCDSTFNYNNHHRWHDPVYHNNKKGDHMKGGYHTHKYDKYHRNDHKHTEPDMSVNKCKGYIINNPLACMGDCMEPTEKESDLSFI